MPIDQSALDHYDDSSDEERDDDEIEINERVNQFSTSIRKGNSVAQKEIEQNSFLIYQYGLLVSHGAEVRANYKLLKKKYLSNSTLPSEDELHAQLKEAITKAIHDWLYTSVHPKASKKVIAQCQIAVDKEISQLAQVCVANLRKLFRTVLHGAQLPDVINSTLGDLFTAVESFIEQGNYDDFIPSDFKPPLHITAENLLKIDKIKEWCANSFKNELAEIDQVSEWIKGDGFPGMKSLLTRETKDISSSGAAKATCNQILKEVTLTPLQIKYIQKIKGLSHSKWPSAFQRDFITDFFKQKLEESIAAEQARAEHSILQQSHIRSDADLSTSLFFKQFDGFLEEFILCNKEQMRQLLLTKIKKMTSQYASAFLFAIRGAWKSLEINVSRTTLPSHFTHEVDSVASYIASLKLTNRSIARTVRNQSQESILGSSKEENHDFGWQFKASKSYSAIERNRITKLARSALMPIQTSANAYNDIVEKIRRIRSKTDMTDKVVAECVRKVLHGDLLILPNNLNVKNKEDITMFIIQLTHLLCGIECMRYPATFIANQMVLDLIIAEQLSWQEALTPNDAADKIYLAMTMKEATEVSRTLVDRYKKYTCYTHHYPGHTSSDIAKIDAFVSVEKRLTDKWFAFFKAQPDKKEIKFADALKESIPKWYPGITI